jgi:hypothetical protein
MQLVLRNFRPHRRKVQDLMAERVWVLAAKRMAAPAAMRGLEGLGVIGREEGSLLPRVPGLTTTPAARRRARGPALDGGRVGGGGPGRVGRVLIQPALQLVDLPPQLGYLGPKCCDQGSGFGGQAVPQVSRKWRPSAHSADIARMRALGYVRP